ncbi:hypothetical protein JAAARDRAFT_152710 [Jaapia argillacea MUCL 33604]|uniref:3-beta hydroxysteroid dehydrogenase/isomerase domain-containing protein n=1 Tax=Jaapia argillacea MUCL 33604 TaxID=933084 RepID=A0A067Q9H6_9AGAM|nr:hypothetical protein JAAARDRAFT_152710 [Jaapia argillacea MUCL 33604]
MGAVLWTIGSLLALLAIFLQYLRGNDKKLSTLPAEALAFSPKRFTNQSVREAFERYQRAPISVADQLPPKTGHRYIVVGGGGFLGGWIVLHLIQRGEDPKRIRILDIRPPTRKDLTTGAAQSIDFKRVDICDAAAVLVAFQAPWADPSDQSEITVFHTAANIRFYERHPSLVSNSAKVNVEGTRNVIDAACSIGAGTLIYTSSGSVCVKSSRFWLWPWQREPDMVVQVLNDDDTRLPKRHEEFFSNYAVTKIQAESLVRAANGRSIGTDGKTLRTGCVRPGNGIFGPGGDILCGAYLVRKNNPTWIPNILQSFIYVENCSLAHLCYEQRLIELSQGSTNPDISGQAFNVADPCPPITYGDVYTTLSTLTDGETTFPLLSPTAMLLLSHLMETYYLSRYFLVSSSSALSRFLGGLLPPLNGDIVNLQPSLFALTMVHLIFDDSRARLPPAKGGLGYEGAWTTLEGMCKLVQEHKRAGELLERSLGGGVSFGFGLVKAEAGVKKVQDGVKEGLDIDAVHVLN